MRIAPHLMTLALAMGATAAGAQGVNTPANVPGLQPARTPASVPVQPTAETPAPSR